MKVLYDFQTFTQQYYGGISRYFCELITSLRRIDNISKYEINPFFSNNINLRKYGIGDYIDFLPNLNFLGKRKLFRFINQHKTRKILAERDFDLFHPTYYHDYFLEHLKGRPYIITVHDLIYDVFNAHDSYSNRIRREQRRVIENSKHIIAISESTRNDIIKYYMIAKDKISVVHHGVTKLKEDRTIKITLPTKYILYVGDRNCYKNFNHFICSVAPIMLEKRIYVICAGSKYASKSELKVLCDNKIDGLVIFYPKIDDSMLSYLYRNAITFVFPSLYEGFGLPLLEAFQLGCPVVCSNTSSLPEIAGDAAIYFDPTIKETIYSKVLKVINNNDLRNALIKKGYERVKNFDWKTTAEKTNCVYRKIL